MAFFDTMALYGCGKSRFPFDGLVLAAVKRDTRIYGVLSEG
jgi:hypothetical protein